MTKLKLPIVAEHKMTTIAMRRIQTITAASLIALFATAYSSGNLSGRADSERDSSNGEIYISLKNQPFSWQTDNCASCHEKLQDQTTSLFAHSAHARNGITCNRCHGGDPSATDKSEAHGGKFTGLPSAEETIAMCGTCHRPQLASFKSSKHYPENRDTPRLDCSQCHGAHLVGSPDRNFSIAYFCAGCHGLEYLPELPKEFQKMLTMVDGVTDSMRPFWKDGRAISEEVINRRKEFRRLVAEIIHPADLNEGIEKSPDIIKLGDELKSALEREKKR